MKFALVNTSIKNIYNNSKEFSEVSDEILYGMTLQIINEIKKTYIYVRTEYDYEGYTTKNNLLTDYRLIEHWLKERNAVIINNFADILEKPNIKSRILICIPRGSMIIATNNMSNDNIWTQVQLINGSSGWIKSNFLRYNHDIIDYNSNEIEFRENLVNDAFLYLGTQYRWGGKTPKGIDCSGLCSMVYMLNGIKIYRDANINSEFPIKKISLKNAKKGDLLFFPGHVAMYLGKDRYIHSSNINNIVKINSLNSSHPDYREDLSKNLIAVGSIF